MVSLTVGELVVKGTDGHFYSVSVNEDGQVVWSIRKPADVPEQYSLTDVASFTRWYLGDYPVQCRIREDGLLVGYDAAEDALSFHPQMLTLEQTWEACRILERRVLHGEEA